MTMVAKEASSRGWALPNVRFGSKADMCSALAYVCFVPKADIASLIDDFVGASDQGRRHG